jgi:ATP-dependent helicase HrpB
MRVVDFPAIREQPSRGAESLSHSCPVLHKSCFFMMPSAPALPIDDILPALRRALAHNAAAVLQAEPGAGKTTRVPLALLDEAWLAGRRILLLEPRRLAATNAARYMAACLGEEVGRTVGYTIRFERCAGAATRIEVVTEGILIRRLQADPTLDGVGLVIFDEFHERSLHSDLALALCRDAQLGLREDLKLLVMSATLDGEPVARLLGDAPLLSCPGRCHAVDVSWLPRDPKGPIAETAARAVRRALRENQGDILVFLPGAGEIRRCRELLREAWPADGPTVCCLYGELPFAEQERALRPGPRRKVVLATNIAETSLTIDGVQVVIDSGFMRRMRFDADAGLPRLETVRVTAANAEQRAGRAGRLGPGRCYRLWSEATQAGLLPFAAPQMRGADLAPLALELARWGVREPAALCWLDAPPDGALAGARSLLRQLGALDDRDRLTPLGEAMAALPAHPRVAALLETGRRTGLAAAACDLAALLEERDLLRGTRQAVHATDSDLLDRLDLLRAWRRRERLPAAVDEAACRAVDRIARFWRRRFKVQKAATDLEASTVARLLLAAYPDRLARCRAPGSDRYRLSSGRGACLSPRSGLRHAEFLVAAQVGGGRGGDAFIHQASAVSRALLEECFADRMVWRRRVFWDADLQRVVACEEQCWGSLALVSRPAEADDEEASAALLDGLRQVGLEALPWTDKARQLQWRVALLAGVFPEQVWPDLSDAALRAHLEEWLAPYMTGWRRLADLARLDLTALLRDRLTWPQQRQLETDAPTHVAVPSGHRVAMTYREGGPPVLAVKLQELFGLAETPTVASARVAVQLHLLSPARRPLAVTQDLRHFWDAVYPEVRREMAGRYPRHPWPDDPWRATPTRAAKKRKTP